MKEKKPEIDAEIAKDLKKWDDLWEASMPVKNATLHAAVSVGGFATEKTINKDKLIGAKLRRDPDGHLLILFRDIKAIVNSATVQCIILDL